MDNSYLEMSDDMKMFFSGYDAGVWEVCDALITFVGQGGHIDINNVNQWVDTYNREEIK
jgi:hypothetical protein